MHLTPLPKQGGAGGGSGGASPLTPLPKQGRACAPRTETAEPLRSAKAVQNTFQIDSHQTRMPGTVLFV